MGNSIVIIAGNLPRIPADVDDAGAIAGRQDTIAWIHPELPPKGGDGEQR